MAMCRRGNGRKGRHVVCDVEVGWHVPGASHEGADGCACTQGCDVGGNGNAQRLERPGKPLERAVLEDLHRVSGEP